MSQSKLQSMWSLKKLWARAIFFRHQGSHRHIKIRCNNGNWKIQYLWRAGFGLLFCSLCKKNRLLLDIKKSHFLCSFIILFVIIIIYVLIRLHGGVVVSTVASQQEGSRFDPHLGPFGVELACSPRVCVGSLRVLWLPPTVQKHAC